MPASTPTCAAPVPADQPADARAQIEARLTMLTRLAEIGMGIAEDAGRRSRALADGGEAGAHETDPGLTYARAARAVRLTLALQSRLLAELAELDAGAALDSIALRRARRNRIERMVELAIEAEHDDANEIERLSGEARERLDDEDEFGDLLARPFDEIVAGICSSLGLSPDWNAEAFAMVRGAETGACLPFTRRVSARPTGGASGRRTGLKTVPPPDPPRLSSSP